MCEGLRVCLYTTRQDSTARRILRAPATLVCTGSFISSPITGPLFPLLFWMGFRSLIITTVTSDWRACESGDQLVFFLLFLSACLTPRSLRVFHSHTGTQCHPALLGLARVTLLSLTGECLCLASVCGQPVKKVM